MLAAQHAFGYNGSAVSCVFLGDWLQCRVGGKICHDLAFGIRLAALVCVHLYTADKAISSSALVSGMVRLPLGSIRDIIAGDALTVKYDARVITAPGT